MPKSLLVITGIFPPDSGGPAKFALEFSEWASKECFEVYVQTYSDGFVANPNISTFRMSAVSRSHNLFIRYSQMIKAIGRNVKRETSVLAVGAFLETYISSLIFRFSYTAKVPGDIVWERARNNGVTNLGIEEFQNGTLGIKYKIFRQAYSRSLRKASIVIVPSKGLYKICLGWGVSESKLKLIYNSVDVYAEPRKLSISQTYNLITVCRLASWKGVDELINFVANRNLSLLVVGDGPERMRLESLALSLQAKVSFVGEVSQQKVYELLVQSQVFVLNSYYEGLPHALIEARAAGVFSVGRAGTGSAEVINDDLDGFLIRPGRSLEVTLDLALATQPTAHIWIARAKSDSFQRFSKAENYTAILKLIHGDIK
jgi:glycosyltransferase involved in cell wall biosynthesis